MKQVRIITSFGGGDDPSEERRAALTYTVVKYIVEQCAAKRRLTLNVQRCIKYVGDITDPIFEEIAKADVVIAILDRLNPTVVFELSFRYTLRGQIILVVLDEDAVPFYLKDTAYVEFPKELLGAIQGETQDTDNFPELSFESCPMSQKLEKLLKDIDKYIPWCEALDGAIASEPSPSPLFEGAVLPLLRRRIVSAEEGPEQFALGPWARAAYYPLSILKVAFHRMSDIDNGRYDPAHDLDGEPVIFDANRGFAKIFNITFRDNEEVFPQLQRRPPLNFGRLMGRLTGAGGSERLGHRDWDLGKFTKDQERLRNWVLFFDAEAPGDLLRAGPKEKELYAREPIRLAQDHPVEEMRGESFLPCLIAKRHSGEFSGPHSAYLEIAYIDVTHVIGTSAPLPGAPMA